MNSSHHFKLIYTVALLLLASQAFATGNFSNGAQISKRGQIGENNLPPLPPPPPSDPRLETSRPITNNTQNSESADSTPTRPQRTDMRPRLAVDSLIEKVSNEDETKSDRFMRVKEIYAWVVEFLKPRRSPLPEAQQNVAPETIASPKPSMKNFSLAIDNFDEPNSASICDFVSLAISRQDASETSAALRSVQVALNLKSIRNLVLLTNLSSTQSIVFSMDTNQFFGITNQKIVSEIAAQSKNGFTQQSLNSKNVFIVASGQFVFTRSHFLDYPDFQTKIKNQLSLRSEGAAVIANDLGCVDPSWKAVRYLDSK